MKILCVIDSLGSGGAQRQMVNLACGLKAKGHDVELFIYHPQLDFFRSIINDAGIPIHEVNEISGFSWKVVRAIAKLLQKRKYDALISFLSSPNIYAILGRFFSRCNPKVVVSERSSREADVSKLKSTLNRFLYAKAQFIVVNSQNHAKYLRRFFWINRKIKIIYNGYVIHPIPQTKTKKLPKRMTFLIVGRISIVKNGYRLLQSLLLFKERNGYLPSLLWAGRQEQDLHSLNMRTKMDKVIASNSELQTMWHWLGERSDTSKLFANCDALVHLSLYEGLPNVVCEAFIAGRPVIASKVCDHPILVEEGVRGLLCDPLSPESICEAIERFAALSPEEWEVMGRNARRYAEKHLTLERMVNEYEALLSKP